MCRGGKFGKSRPKLSWQLQLLFSQQQQ